MQTTPVILDGNFPESYQGNWNKSRHDTEWDGNILAIKDRSLIYCGVESDFKTMTAHIDESGVIQGIILSPAPDHEDALNWKRYNVYALVLQDENSKLLIATAKWDDI